MKRVLDNISAINYAEYEHEHSGKVELIGRVKYVFGTLLSLHKLIGAPGVIPTSLHATIQTSSSSTSQMDFQRMSMFTENL